MTHKKTLWWLLAALVILLALYFGLRAFNMTAQKKEAKKTEDAAVYVVQEKELTQFTYAGTAADAASMSFTLAEDGWRDAADPAISLNQSAVQGIADQIAVMKATRKLKAPDSRADYGLDQPAYTITLKNADGKETVVYIGGMTGADYYAGTDRSEDIYTIDSSLVSALVFDISELVQ